MVELDLTDPAWQNYCWAMNWTNFQRGISVDYNNSERVQARYNHELSKFNGRCDVNLANDCWVITFNTEADKFMFMLKWSEHTDSYQE